jgi:outer membrane lipoprotein SlyB
MAKRSAEGSANAVANAAARTAAVRLPVAAATLPVAAATLLLALGLQGCVGSSMSSNMSTSSSPSQASSGSTPAQPQQQVIVRLGVVQNARPTQISANGTQSSGFGSSATGSENGLAGGPISAGRTALVTGEVGNIAGAVAGNAVENGVAIRDGLEITVRLDSGELSAIDQLANGETFQAGDRVRVLSGDGGTRVTH